MNAMSQTATSTEAVAVFEDAETLQAAIDELESAGFDRAELSLLASEQAVDEKLGHIYDKVEDLEDDPRIPRTAYVANESVGSGEGALIGGLLYVGAGLAAGMVVASGGTLAAAIMAAVEAGGLGGLIGAVMATMLGDEHAIRIQEQLDHGGLLLWVRTRDAEHESKAVAILRKHSAHDVHLHELA